MASRSIHPNIPVSSERDRRTKDLIKDLSTPELSILLNCYCTPHSTLTCQKKYGFILSRVVVEKEILNRTMEDMLVDE